MNMTILLNQFGLVVMDGMPLGQSGSEFGGIQYAQDDIKKELGNEFTRILKLVNDNIIQDKTSEDILKILRLSHLIN